MANLYVREAVLFISIIEPRLQAKLILQPYYNFLSSKYVQNWSKRSINDIGIAVNMVQF